MDSQTPMDALLSFDPVKVVEEVTGLDSRTDEKAGLLVLGLAMHHGRAKDRLLTELGDTTLSNKTSTYVEIITNMGFEKCFEEEFHRGSIHKCDDTLFAYIQKKFGLFLVFDTYTRSNINGSHLFFCWKRNPGEELVWPNTGGGHYESESDPDWRKSVGCTLPSDAYWRGNMDGREALLHHITQLMEAGTLLSPWPKLKIKPIDLCISCNNDYAVAEDKLAAEGKTGNRFFDEKCNLVDVERIRRYNLLPADVKAILNVEF